MSFMQYTLQNKGRSVVKDYYEYVLNYVYLYNFLKTTCYVCKSSKSESVHPLNINKNVDYDKIVITMKKAMHFTWKYTKNSMFILVQTYKMKTHKRTGGWANTFWKLKLPKVVVGNDLEMTDWLGFS